MQRSTTTPPTAAMTGHGDRRRTSSRTTARKTSHAPSTTARCVHERNEVCTARVATSRAAGMPSSSQRSSGSSPSVDSRARHGRVAPSHVARAAAAPGRRTSRVRDANTPITSQSPASSSSPRAIQAIAMSRSARSHAEFRGCQVVRGVVDVARVLLDVGGRERLELVAIGLPGGVRIRRDRVVPLRLVQDHRPVRREQPQHVDLVVQRAEERVAHAMRRARSRHPSPRRGRAWSRHPRRPAHRPRSPARCRRRWHRARSRR